MNATTARIGTIKREYPQGPVGYFVEVDYIYTPGEAATRDTPEGPFDIEHTAAKMIRIEGPNFSTTNPEYLRGSDLLAALLMDNDTELDDRIMEIEEGF